jgi:hypothetical protein
MEVVKDKSDNLDTEFYNIEDLKEFIVKAEQYCNYSSSVNAGYLIKDYSLEENGYVELLKDYPTLDELNYFADLIGVDSTVNKPRIKKRWAELIIQHQSIWGRTKLVKGLNKIPTTLPVVYKREGISIPANLSYRVRAADSKYSLMPTPKRIRPYYQIAPNTVEEVSYLVLLDPVKHIKDLSLEHMDCSLNLQVEKNYYNLKLDRKETLNSMWHTGKSIFMTFQFIESPNKYLFIEYVVNLEPNDLVKASIVNNYELLTKDTLLPYELIIDINGVKIVNKVCSLTRSSTLTISKYKIYLTQSKEDKNTEWSELKIEPDITSLTTEKNPESVQLIQALNTITENIDGYYKTIELRMLQKKE